MRLETGDSLGRWLYGVSVRVARQARAATAVRRPFFQKILTVSDPVDPLHLLYSIHSIHTSGRTSCAAIDAEIARLPARYRSAVVLCHLEGLPQEQAARRLRCPLGTVQSRLHRARERLRSGLVRRGLRRPEHRRGARGHVAGVRAAQPAQKLAAAAARFSAGESLSGTVTSGRLSSDGIDFKANGHATNCGMIVAVHRARPRYDRRERSAGARRRDDPKPAPPSQEPNPPPVQKPEWRRRLADPSLAQQFDRLKSEYENADREFHSFYRGSYIPKENLEKALQVRPDLPAFVRRIAAMGMPSPKDPAVRDAMLWVISQAAHADDRTIRWRIRRRGELAPPQPRR